MKDWKIIVVLALTVFLIQALPAEDFFGNRNEVKVVAKAGFKVQC